LALRAIRQRGSGSGVITSTEVGHSFSRRFSIGFVEKQNRQAGCRLQFIWVHIALTKAGWCGHFCAAGAHCVNKASSYRRRATIARFCAKP